MRARALVFSFGLATFRAARKTAIHNGEAISRVALEINADLFPEKIWTLLNKFLHELDSLGETEKIFTSTSALEISQKRQNFSTSNDIVVDGIIIFTVL